MSLREEFEPHLISIPGIYCNGLKPPLDRDCLNACLNIAKQKRDDTA